MYTGHVSTIYSLLTSFTGELCFVSSVRSEITLICKAFTHKFLFKFQPHKILSRQNHEIN